MGWTDEIDADLARHFAWTFVPADQVDAASAAAERMARAQAPTETAVENVAAGDDEDGEAFRVEARALCEPLAEAVGAAWSCADLDLRARMTKRLLVRAERLGISLVGMIDWPVESARLLRLVVALGPRTTKRQAERATAVASVLPLDHPEAAELLVEVARAGDGALADAIFCEEGWYPDVGDEASLVARLADVVDDGPTHAARSVAIDILSHFPDLDPALGALRRGLRIPSFAVRARALDALASAEPCALSPADLVGVLRDLVAHAPPESLVDEEREVDEQRLGDAVLVALAHVQPEDAAEALLDFIDAEHSSLWLDAGWATEALALGFPETGAAMVDHWLQCARMLDRYKAIGALRRLPLPMAKPRLGLAVRDPGHLVREAARSVWLERFGESFVSSAQTVLGASLLKAPPSERFLPRLAVLEGRVAEARQAMARALLAEAPDPEALVLLLQFLGDDTEAREPACALADGWAVSIVQHFEALGVEGLRILAERFPEPESFGWIRRFGDLVEKGLVPREQLAPLRELAARHVLSEDAGQIDDALRLLTLVGPRPELIDRVMTVALTDDLGAWEARKLLAAWPDRSVDSRLVSEMALAIADRDWARLYSVAWMAMERDLPGARVLAQRVLELGDETEDAVDAAVICATALRARGVLDDAWALAALRRPESPIFTVAARTWRDAPEVREALEAALASAARAGASAAAAAIALLAQKISPRDRRLRAVLRSAPGPERAELFMSMCVHGAPFSVLEESVEPLFTSADERVTGALMGLSGWLRSPKATAMLRRLLPGIVDPELKADVEEQLGEVPVPYWAEG